MKRVRSPFSLYSLCIRSISICLFQAQVRWRRLSDLYRILSESAIGLPRHLRIEVDQALTDILAEVTRWSEKHAQMFDGDAKPVLKERAPRFEHLRTYYHCIKWKRNKYEINDIATARSIMKKECHNWPQMRFQFACVYAMQDLIRDDRMFDRYYRSTFKTRLAYHPVYDFWLTLLETDEERLFNMDNRPPNQKIMLAFRFAVTHGYLELTKFFWSRVSPTQREYIALLQWRALCFRTRDRDTLHYLSVELAKVNLTALVRLTWTVFCDALNKALTGTDQEKIAEERKIRFLLANVCKRLRTKLLQMENYKAIIDAYYYKNDEIFGLLLEYISDSQVRAVRERVDRIIDRKKSVETNLHRALIRRQVTFDSTRD